MQSIQGTLRRIGAGSQDRAVAVGRICHGLGGEPIDHGEPHGVEFAHALEHAVRATERDALGHQDRRVQAPGSDELEQGREVDVRIADAAGVGRCGPLETALNIRSIDGIIQT